MSVCRSAVYSWTLNLPWTSLVQYTISHFFDLVLCLPLKKERFCVKEFSSFSLGPEGKSIGTHHMAEWDPVDGFVKQDYIPARTSDDTSLVQNTKALHKRTKQCKKCWYKALIFNDFLNKLWIQFENTYLWW